MCVDNVIDFVLSVRAGIQVKWQSSQVGNSETVRIKVCSIEDERGEGIQTKGLTYEPVREKTINLGSDQV